MEPASDLFIWRIWKASDTKDSSQEAISKLPKMEERDDVMVQDSQLYRRTDRTETTWTRILVEIETSSLENKQVYNWLKPEQDKFWTRHLSHKSCLWRLGCLSSWSCRHSPHQLPEWRSLKLEHRLSSLCSCQD